MSSDVRFRCSSQDVASPRGRQADKPSLFGSNTHISSHSKDGISGSFESQLSEAVLDTQASVPLLVCWPLLPSRASFPDRESIYQEEKPSIKHIRFLMAASDTPSDDIDPGDKEHMTLPKPGLSLSCHDRDKPQRGFADPCVPSCPQVKFSMVSYSISSQLKKTRFMAPAPFPPRHSTQKREMS